MKPGNRATQENDARTSILNVIAADVTIKNNGSETEYWRQKSSKSPSAMMAKQAKSRLCIYPRNGIDTNSRPAYSILSEIQLEHFPNITIEVSDRHGEYISNLPKGLGSIFRYGLTFPKRYRPLVASIEKIGCTTLRLTQDGRLEIKGDTLVCSYERFSQSIEEIDRLYNRSSTILSRIKSAIADNLTNEATGKELVDPIRGRNPAIQKLTDAYVGNSDLDEHEEGDLIDLLVERRTALARQPTTKLGRLRNDLNLVTLETLIDRFRDALDDPNHSKQESFWETFFTENPFALQQLFGAPVIHIGNQLQVQSPRSDGGGARITDFILSNSITKEGLIVEIKTPSVSLLHEAKPYRGTGSSAIFRPSDQLSGAVAQLQSQKEALRTRLEGKIEEDDPLHSLNSASPRGALIAGRVNALSGASLKSFRRFRDGLHDVTILGFDEVVDRLEELLKLLGRGTIS